MKSDNAVSSDKNGGPAISVKASYSKPDLKIFGSVRNLTQGQGGTQQDGNSTADAVPGKN